MNYRVVCVGKIKEEFYRKRVEEYAAMINKRHRLQIQELQDERTYENMSDAERKKILHVEGERILHVLQPDSKELVVALCIDGKQYSSDAWSRRVNRLAQEKEYQQITYVIGGSLGLDELVVKRSDLKLSFSNLTFPHQLMRVMLLEQIANNSIYL